MLFDALTRNLWLELADEQLQAMTTPALEAANLLDMTSLQKQLSFVCKLVDIVKRVAKLCAWRDAGIGSLEATALTAESAQWVADLKLSLDRLGDFVEGTLAHASVPALGLAIMTDETPSMSKPALNLLWDASWGYLWECAQGMTRSITSELVDQWTTTLQKLG